MSLDFIQMISDLKNRRLLQTMRVMCISRTPCGIFFPPKIPDNARQIVDELKSVLNLNCICVLSNEYKKYFPAVDGERVIALEEFENLDDKPEYIFGLGFFEWMFMDHFARYGVKMISSINAEVAEGLYNNYAMHLPELYSVHEMFADEESKKVFRASIIGDLTKTLQDYRFAPEPQYFLNGFFPTAGDIAIDGGAYDGATAADFVKQGAQVYAFEMVADNYKNCLPVAEKFGFTLENLGLSDQESDANYLSRGAGSRKFENGDLVAHFIDIDSYVRKKNLPRVDYIKLDVEGAELDVLRGAAKTITRWKPKMAVSAYHKFEDLWTLATYIKSLRPDYEFQFRHYRIDVTDYTFNDDERAVFRYFGLSYFCPCNCEMVLYCR